MRGSKARIFVVKLLRRRWSIMAMGTAQERSCLWIPSSYRTRLTQICCVTSMVAFSLFWFFFFSSFFSFVYFCPSTQSDSSDVLPRSCCLIIPMPSHVQGALLIMDVVPKLHVGEVRSLEGYYTEEEKGLLSSHFSGVIWDLLRTSPSKSPADDYFSYVMEPPK